MCRRGLDMRTTTYTDEFVWEDQYHGFGDLAPLVEFVTVSTRTARKKRSRATQPHGEEDYSLREQQRAAQANVTPKKRRATQDPTSSRFVSLLSIQPSMHANMVLL